MSNVGFIALQHGALLYQQVYDISTLQLVLHSYSASLRSPRKEKSITTYRALGGDGAFNPGTAPYKEKALRLCGLHLHRTACVAVQVCARI